MSPQEILILSVKILKILKELNAQGITIIMVTHEEEIGEQANRLIRLRDGVIQSDERKKDFSTSQRKETAAATAFSGIRLQEVFEHFRQGFKTLLANKIRTGLSMLGILIGVAAVVAMLALGNGAQKQIESQLSSLGSNLLVLRSGSIRVGGVFQDAGANTRLSIDDINSLTPNIPSIKEISATVNGRGQITYLNKNWSTQIQGSSAAFPRIRASQPEIGRFFTEEENRTRTKVAVLGMTVVRELFGDQNPVGEMIKINKVSFVVIGVLPEKGASGWRDQDDIVVIPVLTAMYRLLGKTHVDSVDIEVKSSDQIPETQDQILDLMFSRKKVPLSQQDNAFEIRNMADIQEALSQTSKTMSALLASIAAISLLVGGIGIMNIMLVSVTERTKEIGLRKAIGARRVDILLQFLAESTVISAAGGIIGLILGWLITVGISFFTGWLTSISLSSIFLSVFFSGLIGIIFGIYPARKASELHPIDALRYE